MELDAQHRPHKARQLSLFWVRSIQSTHHLISWWLVLTLSSYIHLCGTWGGVVVKVLR